MYERERSLLPADILDLETVRLHPPGPDEDPSKMPAPGAFRIVVAGHCRLAWDPQTETPKVTVAARWSHDEPALLERIVKLTEGVNVLVGFNSRKFDLPVILGACMRHTIPWPWFFRTYGVRMRYKDAGAIDLCDELSDYGAATMMGLDNWGRVTGLGRKTDNGTSVEALWQESPEAVARYCVGDIRLTAHLFVRWLLVRGELSAERSGALHAAIDGAQASVGMVGAVSEERKAA